MKMMRMRRRRRRKMFQTIQLAPWLPTIQETRPAHGKDQKSQSEKTPENRLIHCTAELQSKGNLEKCEKHVAGRKTAKKKSKKCSNPTISHCWTYSAHRRQTFLSSRPWNRKIDEMCYFNLWALWTKIFLIGAPYVSETLTLSVDGLNNDQLQRNRWCKKKSKNSKHKLAVWFWPN